MPRLFTALELSDASALALSLRRGGLPGARWIDPENYHITLNFIGDLPLSVTQEVGECLGHIRGFGPIDICLEHLDAFGGDKPRSIFARVQPVPDLMELKATLDAALWRIGVKSEKRKFVPHVTLARLRGATSLQVADYLEANGSLSALRFSAKRFVLLSSRSSVGGGPYAYEQVYELEDYENDAEWGWS